MSSGGDMSDKNKQKYWTQYDVWDHEMPLVANGKHLTLRGHSISAEKSGFYIPEWRLFLDAGIQSPFSPELIFVSHGHSDHSFALPMLLKNITTFPSVFVPPGTAVHYENFVRSVEAVSSDGQDRTGPGCRREYTLREFQTPTVLAPSLPTITAVPVPTVHSVRSVGVAFFETRRKLKPEFSHLPGKEIAALSKLHGATHVMAEVQVPLLVDTGDTTTEVFSVSQNARMFADNVFPYIITECTFVDGIVSSSASAGADGGEPPADDSLSACKRANECQHTCWSQLEPWVRKMPMTTFIVTHFSARYALSDVVAFFAQPGMPLNVCVWTN